MLPKLLSIRIFLQKARSYLVTLLAFLPQPCNQGTPPGAGSKKYQPHQKCYKPSERRYYFNKERSFSTTLWFRMRLVASLEVCNVSHSQQACNWDNQNMIKVTQMFFQWRALSPDQIFHAHPPNVRERIGVDMNLVSEQYCCNKRASWPMEVRKISAIHMDIYFFWRLHGHSSLWWLQRHSQGV